MANCVDITVQQRFENNQEVYNGGSNNYGNNYLQIHTE